VDHVFADRGAVSQTQRVHRAHVAQHAPAQVMDVIELDLVLHRDRRPVAPTPTDRDARVELVADVVVSHLVVAAVADPYANRSLMDASGGVDDVVVADDVTGQSLRLVGVDAGVADHHASAAQIVQPAPLDAATTAAAAEPGAVSADVLHLASFDRDVPSAVHLDRRRNRDLGLAVAVARRRQHVLAVLEAQTLDRHVLDELPGVGLAGDPHELFERGGHHGGGGHVLVRPRQVRQRPVAVQEPFAGLIQRRAEILDGVTAIGPPVGKAPGHAGRNDHRAGRRIGARQSRTRSLPGMIRDQRDVIDPFRRYGTQRLDVFRACAEGAVREVGHLSCGRIEAAVHLVQDVVVELVRTPRPDRPAAVDPQLFEVPSARGHFGNSNRPDAVGPAHEPGDWSPAGETRRGVRSRLVADRAGLRTAVGRRQYQRFGHHVLAVSDQHPHRFGQRPPALQLADRLARPGQRGQRAVGPVGGGGGEPPRPGVVALGRHVQRRGVQGIPGAQKDRDHQSDRSHENRTHDRFLIFQKGPEG